MRCRRRALRSRPVAQPIQRGLCTAPRLGEIPASSFSRQHTRSATRADAGGTCTCLRCMCAALRVHCSSTGSTCCSRRPTSPPWAPRAHARPSSCCGDTTSSGSSTSRCEQSSLLGALVVARRPSSRLPRACHAAASYRLAAQGGTPGPDARPGPGAPAQARAAPGRPQGECHRRAPRQRRAPTHPHLAQLVHEPRGANNQRARATLALAWRAQEMCDQRRRDLEAWMWKLLGQPALSRSTALRAFLEWERAMARAQKDAAAASAAASSARCAFPPPSLATWQHGRAARRATCRVAEQRASEWAEAGWGWATSS